MGLWQYILNTVLLDLWQLCETDENQCNMGPLGSLDFYSAPLYELCRCFILKMTCQHKNVVNMLFELKVT